MVIKEELKSLFQEVEWKESYRKEGENNPLITSCYGADPYALVFGDQIYVYMTNDEYMYDAQGNITANTYSNIRSIRCISSADLVNWTNHGLIFVKGSGGVTSWAHNSWAPAAIHKKINGKDKFFLYFANSASSIGVLTADFPEGPFSDPLGKPIITRETPNCSGVVWLFDPAVFTDDDGVSYLYFGGGVPEGKTEFPGTARVIRLSEDMIHTEGSAVAIDAPFMFEDSGINKIGDTYVYSYCSNWDSREHTVSEHVPEIGEIIYMTSKNPMGPWEYRGSILKNPGKFFGVYGNNHHCMAEFRGSWYMFYHTQVLQENIGVKGGYRSTHVNEVKMGEDGSIKPIQADKNGVSQLKHMNPYETVLAATRSDQGGKRLKETLKYSQETKQILPDEIETGDWIKVSGLNFGETGAKTFTLRVICKKAEGAVRVTKDSLQGEDITYAKINGLDSKGEVLDITVPVKEITGVHDIYISFVGSGYSLEAWKFEKA
ncbi:hypothetical protein acsn021_15940 [Anaerocolumna cellulosilytica]|uniref:Uncharacterized protein n=1 Tax=Anaerocolumna cellulosilytica TaxID=433286 RepID=A0A6S6R3D5_9FIRM|nr:glycoside hydrolase family 43 protein [Anaerocolumna cellulosilytica]MBB5197217.1 arabinoxylan arabinofuranohydrolase [Anaerocolumna cellulosilytica]BCJ94025.1 hypothetical protein acsn021_15940 [Anaerocolumna cellulosilytica]